MQNQENGGAAAATATSTTTTTTDVSGAAGGGDPYALLGSLITLTQSKAKTSILDKSLSKGKTDMHISGFALLFSEIVQYCQNRSNSVSELHSKLSDMGKQVGIKVIDLIVLREKNYKREIKLLNMLLFIRSTVWKTLFGIEADKLEHSTDDNRQYYILEKEPVVNRFISVPKDKGNLNCAAFNAGIVEGVLETSGFPAKVIAQWHKGITYYVIEFDESVITRDKEISA